MSRYKNITAILILLVATMAGVWVVPALVKKATAESEIYPFIYYSSVAKELCIVDYKDKEAPVREITGRVYPTEAQADSVLPLLKYRQLMADGRLPDSIGEHEITVQKLRAANVVYNYRPTKKNSPRMGLYIMYESMPRRVGIESPGDVFRLSNDIAFIDAQSNTVNESKSARFREAMLKEGFEFPAQWVNGNLSPRKPYDEGYFVLDAAGSLFHLKMVNGRPFVRNTDAGQQIDVLWFEILEVANKRFYGFLFDKAGNVYIIGNEEGEYKLARLDIDPLDLSKDKIMILGNMLYWTVKVTTPRGCSYYGLDMGTLDRLSEYHTDRTPDKWNRAASLLFPFYLSFEDGNSGFMAPHLHITGFQAFATNILLLLLLLFLSNRSLLRKFADAAWVLVFGIAGFLAVWIVPAGMKKKGSRKASGKILRTGEKRPAAQRTAKIRHTAPVS